MTDKPIFSPDLFSGKTVLVTGGGTGIGFAIAREFGRHGARVIIASKDLDTLPSALEEMGAEGIEAYSYPVNIRDEVAVEQLFDAVCADHGVPDILVNNAGGQFAGRALDISAKGFRAVVDLNLNGTWNMSSAFAGRLVAAGKGGRIQNIVLCLASGMPGMVHAGAARAGVVNMTKTLAYEWGPYGINVNAVAPGTVDTPALANYDPSELDATIRRLPIKRMASPREVAQAMVYLASPAGDYIAGHTLAIDGGEHLIGVSEQVPNPCLTLRNIFLIKTAS